MRLPRPTTRHPHTLTAAIHSRPARILGWLATTTIGLAAITGYATALWKAPDWTHTTKPQDRYNARVLVISTGGAAVVLTGLLYTARNYRLSRRGQVTDRYTKALERLDSTHLYVRIGGIHALEHVMRDSPDHHNDVTEVLAQFTRHHTPARANPPRQQPQMHPHIGRNLPAKPDPDVQAALTALAHRPHRPERQPLDLTRLHLTGVNLDDADLRAWLGGANLTGARLGGANLTHAQLIGTDLTDAELLDANLTGAELLGANLTGAWLGGANLTGARLDRTDLSCAHLDDADLTHAQLHAADLTHARLDDANLTRARLIDANLTRAQINRANLTGARLDDANLTGAWLIGANLTGAQLDRANLTGAWLIGANLTGAQLDGADLTGAWLGPNPPAIPRGWIVVDPETGRLGHASTT